MTATYPFVPKDIQPLWYESNNRQYIIRTRLEANNRWFEAAQCYKIIGDREQYNACMMIFRCNEWGDNYREAARPILKEIELVQNKIQQSIDNPAQLIEFANELKYAQERLSNVHKTYYDGNTAKFLFDFLKEQW